MAGAAMVFNDSAAYERFMGRWSRAVAPVFLAWLGARQRASWLDVGCGTGILAETLLELCAPASIDAVDPAPAQVKAATRSAAAGRVAFKVADACKLPFADQSFDVVASALVINFIADRATAMSEMRRVARIGEQVAAYVWDFAEELSPSGPLRKAMRRVGADVPGIPGTDASRLDALRSLFQAAGFEQIETRTIDVCLAYADFDDFWQAQTPAYTPIAKVIAAMKDSERTRLMHAVATDLPTGPNGSIEYCARANAIKARAPR
jgi:ubiquinone/menaquinone biosynthesis C-methylase UbiE